MSNSFISCIACLLILSGYPSPSTSQRNIDPELQRKIDEHIQSKFLPENNVEALGLTIIRDDGSLLYTTGYGMANREKGIQAGNKTQFLLGSISKSFTGLLVADLLYEHFPELGVFALDTPIRKLLPSSNFTLNDRFRSEQTTFRDLLAHRTCTSPPNIFFYAESLESTADLSYRSRYTGEACHVRTDFRYSNQMYVMAGELAGEIAGKSYEEAMHDLWNKLGMFNTTLVKATDVIPDMEYRAHPYYYRDNATHPFSPALINRMVVGNPAGGVYSTPNDMVRYIQLHLNMGMLDGNQVIPEAVIRWTRQPSNLFPSYNFKNWNGQKQILNEVAYGLGLWIGSYDGFELIEHSGYFHPYLSQFTVYPGKNLGIYTSTNMLPQGEDPHPMILHSELFEIIHGNDEFKEKSKLLSSQLKDKQKMEKNGMTEEEFYEKFMTPTISKEVNFIGKYGSGSSGELEISERFNDETNQMELYMEYGKWYKGWLKHVQGFVYTLEFDTDAIQDTYVENAVHLVAITQEETPQVLMLKRADGIVTSDGVFTLGESLDTLPVIPWDPRSC